MSNKEIQKKISDRLVALIDIIFGVVVASSFLIIFENNSSSQLELYSYLLLFLAYAAIVLSWIGYHQMIEYNYYSDSFWGYSRFILDILLVFLYAILIYSYKDVVNFFILLPIIFIIYATGGFIRNKEYKKEVSWQKGSIIYAVIFILVNLIYHFILTDYIKISDNNTSVIILFPFTLFLFVWYRKQRHKTGYKK